MLCGPLKGTVTAPVETFAYAATQFCAWAEGPPGEEAAEVSAARLHLARLYLGALALREPGRGDEWEDWEPSERTEPSWRDVFQRFGALPFNYYSCVDPHVVPTDETVIGDLADDLADIWRDLRIGLWAYRGGDLKAAEAQWRSSFTIHWGRHAADALLALHRWEPKASAQ